MKRPVGVKRYVEVDGFAFGDGGRRPRRRQKRSGRVRETPEIGGEHVLSESSTQGYSHHRPGARRHEDEPQLDHLPPGDRFIQMRLLQRLLQVEESKMQSCQKHSNQHHSIA